MRRVALAAVVVLICTMFVSSSVLAQSKPEFRLGFKVLADQIPNIVGEPLENEHWDANGDSIQRTTTGLMVWRNSDRWTAFTNGYMTWILGPYGLQSRLNTQLYPWENVPPGPTPVSQPSSAPISAPVSVPVPTPTPVPAPPPAPPAAAPISTQTYSPDVKAMDAESGGPGVMVRDFVQVIDEEWARVWGWRPHRPTTVYLYYDGYRLATGMNEILGSGLSYADMDRVATTNVSARGVDRRTGGWAILMHLSYRWGEDDWEATTKATFLYEYTHLMMTDLVGGAGPQWFREGFAQWSTYNKVGGTISERSVTDYTAQAKKDGSLPSLQTLQSSWPEVIASSPQKLETAYGASFLAVKYLTQKVGGMPPLQVLQRTAAGEDFESALQAVTGYNLNILNGEYRSIIPDI